MKKESVIFQIGIILILVFLFFTNCRNNNKESKVHMDSNALTEDFDLFYDRFHTDSLFQVSRLKFPIEGGPDRGDNNEIWSRENWSMLKTKIYDVDTTQYKVSYEKLKRSFTQKVWIEDSGFRFEYRFELINDKWFLVSAFELDN